MKKILTELAAEAAAKGAEKAYDHFAKKKKQKIMTSERQLIFGTIGLLYAFVAFTWLGWKVFYKFHDCQDQARDIERSADDTSNLIFSVWIFGGSMPANKKAAAKFYLGKAEPRWQKAIERYAENCWDRAAQTRLAFMLMAGGFS